MIKQIPNPEYNTRPPIVTDNSGMKQAEIAKRALSRGFSWEDSAEGSEFWNGVHGRLTQIAKNGILKE